MTSNQRYDVVIVGGGPAGLSAALGLGRGCRRVLLCDGGTRRNLAAEEVHNFVTRDGTPPDEFRRVARAQLAPYGVELRDAQAAAIEGEAGVLLVSLSTGEQVGARRVLLALGMVDQMLDLPGFARLWGRSIFLCPYCHGWEVRGQAWGLLVTSAAMLEFALLLRGWTSNLTIFTGGAFEVAAGERQRLAGVRVVERPLRALLGDERLEAVELDDGERVPISALFARPPQRQTRLVEGLGLDLDEMGYVRVNPQHETSRKGVHAAGDLTTMRQAAVMAAADGMAAAADINLLLAMAPQAPGGPGS